MNVGFGTGAGHAVYSGRLSLLSAATFPLPSRTSIAYS